MFMLKLTKDKTNNNKYAYSGYDTFWLKMPFTNKNIVRL